MAQHDYIISNATFPAVRTDINNALSAIQTTNSGTSRPTGAVAGQLWLDTTSATTPTLKYYDGADDISLATIDHIGNTVNWLDSTVSITGLSTTATGTVLTLSDSANTTTVNLIIDNQKEIRFRETTANGTNYVALKAPASVSADLTFTLPATDGTNGQALITNGSGVLSFTTLTADGTVDWDTTVKTSGFTAIANKGYFCNTTSSAFTVTLPSSPSAGDEIVIVDYAGTFATNNLTITSTPKINGSINDVSLTTNREATRLVYIDSTQGYIAYSGVNEGTAPSLTDVPPVVATEYLVVAGGAGGGSTDGGGGAGGGAGGYRSSTLNLTTLTNYTVTVGAGGGAGVYPSSMRGGNGSNSVFSTITSAGGGGGGAWVGVKDGNSGGSGGGGSYSGVGGAGNTPSTSPSQGNAGGNGNTSGDLAGGGGGASAVGGNAVASTKSGDGGAGTSNSITGSSVTYAGGGGGGKGAPANSEGVGGAGGGGTGGTSIPVAAGSGTTNRGGGGGGGCTGGGGLAGAGGSGIVIIKYSDVYTVSNSGGGLTFSTASSGGYKITSFTAGTGNIQFS
jgi:hypothetical protein